MDFFKKHKDPILVIGGIVLFFWVAATLEQSYYDSKDKEADKKATAICNVIREHQPNNLALYDECWTVGMEQLGSENN